MGAPTNTQLQQPPSSTSKYVSAAFVHQAALRPSTFKHATPAMTKFQRTTQVKANMEDWYDACPGDVCHDSISYTAKVAVNPDIEKKCREFNEMQANAVKNSQLTIKDPMGNNHVFDRDRIPIFGQIPRNLRRLVFAAANWVAYKLVNIISLKQHL